MSLCSSPADIADEANVEINQFDESIDEWQYVWAAAARGIPELVQSAGTAFGSPGVLDQNRFTVSCTRNAVDGFDCEVFGIATQVVLEFPLRKVSAAAVVTMVMAV